MTAWRILRWAAPLARLDVHADWLDACRRAAAGLRAMLADHPSTRERAEETGTRGEGGDRTLVIDEAAEDIVFAELDKLHAFGRRFVAISEERGEVDYGDPGVRVVVDPIDGSLNAKRGITHHCLSIAVAEGDTMADVVFGFVDDLGTDEEWGRLARRRRAPKRAGPRHRPARATSGRRQARGARNRVRRPALGRRRRRRPPRQRAPSARRRRDRDLALPGRRPRASTAWRPSSAAGRSTAAAGQLIVREAGGVVAFTAYEDPLAAPLDVVPRSPVIAARTERALIELRALPRA